MSEGRGVRVKVRFARCEIDEVRDSDLAVYERAAARGHHYCVESSTSIELRPLACKELR